MVKSYATQDNLSPLLLPFSRKGNFVEL